MSIFINASSKVIVQGMTGSEGTKHTRRMFEQLLVLMGVDWIVVVVGMMVVLIVGNLDNVILETSTI